MGRTSPESKEIAEKAKDKVWPVLNLDYYLIRGKKFESLPPGWVYQTRTRSYITPAVLIQVLSELKIGSRKPGAQLECGFTARWGVYPGRKPDKKWGKVCP